MVYGLLKLSGAKNRKILESYVNILTVDVLAINITRPLAAMVFHLR